MIIQNTTINSLKEWFINPFPEVDKTIQATAAKLFALMVNPFNEKGVSNSSIYKLMKDPFNEWKKQGPEEIEMK